MKNKLFTALLGLGLVFAFGCEPSQNQIASKLENEVIEKHDDAMAKMNKIQKTIHALEKLKHTYMVDSLNHAHHLAKLEDCDKAIMDLQDADKAMMDWMHQFKIPEEEVAAEEKIIYFNAEQIKINDVNTQIDVGIHEGMHFVRRFYDDLADEHKEIENHKSEPVDTSNADVAT